MDTNLQKRADDNIKRAEYPDSSIFDRIAVSHVPEAMLAKRASYAYTVICKTTTTKVGTVTTSKVSTVTKTATGATLTKTATVTR